MIRRVCAWCREATDGLPPPGPGERVSHGICPPCATAVRLASGLPTFPPTRSAVARARRAERRLIERGGIK